MLASIIADFDFELIFLESTRDECKYKLWGIITAPINPIRYFELPSGTVGIKVPLSTSIVSGFTMKKLTKKQHDIIAIRDAKNPYYSSQHGMLVLT